MNKKYLVSAFAVFLLLLNFWLIIMVEKSKSRQEKLIIKNNKLANIVSSKNILVNTLSDNFELSLSSEDYLIDKYSQLKNGDLTTNIKQIVNGKPKLFLRYSEIGCNTCIDEQLKLLKLLSKKIGKENIVVVATYKNMASLIKFKRINRLNFDIFNCKSFGIPLEKANIPFYCVIDNSYSAKLIFVPQKEYPAFTEKYIEIIKKRFFKEKN